MVNRAGELNSRDCSEFPIMLHIQYRDVGEQSRAVKQQGVLQVAAPPPPSKQGRRALTKPWLHTLLGIVNSATVA